jgi:LL-diaminopimelate aminotransferase
MSPAERMQTIEAYYFSKKREEIVQLESKGNNIINMGIGNPDLPTHSSIIEELDKSARETGSNFYQPYKGIPELRLAFKEWYQSVYNVELDSEKNVLPLAGSKEAIMHIHMAFCNPHDSALIPDPAYPTYASTAKLLHITPRYYLMTEKNEWQIDISQLESLIDSSTKILWINYPHMPTGKTASPAKFGELLHLARKHNLLLVNDNPYSFILNPTPRSILSYCELEDNVIELNSLSKSFNMAGWRVGVAVGKTALIKEILKVKSNYDSGMFKPIQKAAIRALSLGNSWFQEMNNEYQQRRVLMWDMLDMLNCKYDKSCVGMFVWAKIPLSFKSSEDFCNHLLYKKGIFVSPGHIFGINGNQFARFSLCVNQDDIKESVKRINSNTFSL